MKYFGRNFKISTIKRAIKVLSKSEQKKVAIVVLIQISLGILDLIGVALIGVLGALAVNGIQSIPASENVSKILELFGIANVEFQTQAAVLGGIATLVLVFRTACSVFFIRKILFFLSRRGASISANLVSKLLSQSILFVQLRSSQEIVYAITTGVHVITLGILGTLVGLISDLALLIIMAAGLFVVDLTIAISTFIVFSIIGVIMYWSTQRRAEILGEETARLNVESNEKILEVLFSYREAVVKNRRNYYSKAIGKVRLELADTVAETTFLPNISKYVIETALVLSALGISSVQFLLQDAAHAVATLSIFLAAGTRIAPAVLRVQQSALTIRSSSGAAGPALDLIESMNDLNVLDAALDYVEVEHLGFVPEIRIQNVSFTYPGKESAAIANISLFIPSGKFVAIVGSSGAGKTTLVDLLLGVLKPENGSILISGKTPLETVTEWPGAMSYVPQDVMISNGTIRENIGLGFPIDLVSDKLVEKTIKIAALEEFVSELPQGIDTAVGERGFKISGGQRQRLGIARAMFTQPALLVLDEATSSLDGKTEAFVSEAIQAMKGKVTIFMIAHRLSTVKNADIVLYLRNGKLLAEGTFAEVRELIPDFDQQAKLMGL